MASGARAEIDYVVGAADGLFVVLDHQHGVAQVAQVFERGQQAAVVAMMQADRRLIEHVEHTAQLASRSALPGECAGLRRRKELPPSGQARCSPVPPHSGTAGAR